MQLLNLKRPSAKMDSKIQDTFVQGLQPMLPFDLHSTTYGRCLAKIQGHSEYEKQLGASRIRVISSVDFSSGRTADFLRSFPTPYIFCSMLLGAVG